MTEKSLSQQQLSQYLKRIKLSQSEIEHLSLTEKLRLVHRRHVMHIPFENLSTFKQQPSTSSDANTTTTTTTIRQRETGETGPNIDLDHVFGKIVSRNRGGYCFEMNTLMAGALRALGFTVMNSAAKVVQRPIYEEIDQEFGVGKQSMTPYAHLILFVPLNISTTIDTATNTADRSGNSTSSSSTATVTNPEDNKSTEQEIIYLVDVGLGGRGMIEPVPIIPDDQKYQTTSAYSIRTGYCGLRKNEPASSLLKNGAYAKGLYLQKNMGEGNLVDLYFFRIIDFYTEDYVLFNFYISQFPNGMFSDHLICSIVTEDDGRYVLFDSKLKRKNKSHENVESIVLESEEDKKMWLKKAFGLDLEQI